jgi:hypothetical protein
MSSFVSILLGLFFFGVGVVDVIVVSLVKVKEFA